MKLTSYNPQVNLGRQQASISYSPVAAAYGADQSGTRQLVAGLNKAIDTIDKIEEQRMVTKVTEANTEYAKRMAEHFNNLSNTQLEGAVGASKTYEELEKETRAAVLKEKGLRYARAVNAFNSMADKDSVSHISALQRHEYAEAEKYKGVTVDNSIAQLADASQSSYMNPMLVRENLAKAKGLVAANFGDRGSEYVDAYMRKANERIVKPVIDEYFAKGDWNGVSKALTTYQQYLSPEQRSAYDSALNAKRKASMAITAGRDLYSRFGGDIGAAQRYLQSGKSFDGAKAMAYAQLAAGAEYNLGGSDKYNSMDCGFLTQNFCAEGGFTLNSRAADMQMYQMEQEGRFTTNRAEAGDYALVFWKIPNDRWPPTDDPNGPENSSYKGVTHVGVLMPNGNVLQMGGDGLKEIPVDSYEIAGYGRIDGGQYSPEEQKAILAEMKSAANDERWMRSQHKEGVMDEAFAWLQQNGDGMTTAQMKEEALKRVGNDTDAMAGWNSAISLYTSGRGGANGNAQRATADTDAFLEDALRRGEIGDKTEMMGTLKNIGITNAADQRKYLKWVDDRRNLKGLFKYNFNDLMKEAINDDTLKGIDREKASAQAAAAGRAFVSRYMVEHNGDEPERYQVIEAIRSSMEMKPRGSAMKPNDWIFDTAMKWSTAEALAAGFSNIVPSGDGAWWATKSSTGEDIYMTSQEVMQALGKEGW